MLTPDLYYSSLRTVDLSVLRDRGIRYLLIDLDNTLLPRDTDEVPGDLRLWAGRLAEEGFSACLLSNNWHERVEAVAHQLGFALVSKALKPLPGAFRRALRIVGGRSEEAAVIGDQLFTDILGGKWAGMTTVLVKPLSRTDLPHTLVLRLIERRLLADREPLA